MSRFTFIKHRDDNNKHDLTNIVFDLNAESLTEIFEQFQNFLSASGFVFDLGERITIESESNFDTSEKGDC